MSQGSLVMPTSGTLSGLQAMQDVNNALAALVSANSGTSSPTNATGGVPVAGQFWLDTSGTLPLLKIYVGSTGAWQTLGAFDDANSLWVPVIGGGTDSLTAAATTDLGSKSQAVLTINGSTGIT